MNDHKTLQSHRCLVGTTMCRCRIIYSTHWSDPMDRLATNHRHRNVHTNRLRSYDYRSRWHRYAAMLAPYAMDLPAEQIVTEKGQPIITYYSIIMMYRWRMINFVVIFTARNLSERCSPPNKSIDFSTKSMFNASFSSRTDRTGGLRLSK